MSARHARHHLRAHLRRHGGDDLLRADGRLPVETNPEHVEGAQMADGPLPFKSAAQIRREAVAPYRALLSEIQAWMSLPSPKHDQGLKERIKQLLGEGR